MMFHPKQPKLLSFKRIMYLIPTFSILSVMLLLWTYRPIDLTRISFQYSPNHRPASAAPARQVVPLLEVNGTRTLLVSAYLEHRTNKKEVRVIAVVSRTETVAYLCHLRCQGQLHVSVGYLDVHQDHFDYEYGTADIMCPVPDSCSTASCVALTSVGTTPGEGRAEPPAFLEVLNQEVKTDSFPHNFTVCFSTMFDFTNTLQLVQSIEMLRLLGVTRVVVYKTSCSPDTQLVLNYYTGTGLMEVIPWHLSSLMNVSRGWQPQHHPGQIHYYGQIPALNDCVYRYMYRSKYLALHDMDELILPQTVDSWEQLLPLLEEKHGSDYGYYFKNNVFPFTATLPPPRSSLHNCCPAWKGVPGVNIMAHLYHEPISQWTHSNFKMIINPRALFRPTVHGQLSSQKGYVWVSSDVARMYHTRAPMETSVTPDQLVYDSRLLGYSSRLILAVNTVLEEVGLIQEDEAQ